MRATFLSSAMSILEVRSWPAAMSSSGEDSEERFMQRATGDRTAIVCALDLAPTQLRIGSHIARAPEEEERVPVIPEIARVHDGGILVEPWTSSK